MNTKVTTVPVLLKEAIDSLNEQRACRGLLPLMMYPMTHAEATTILSEQAEEGLDVGELRRLVGEYADALLLAVRLRDRYMDLSRVWDEKDRQFIHRQFTSDALSEEYDDNTGGWVWNSNSIFKTSSGRFLIAVGNSDSIGVYLSPTSDMDEARDWLFALAGEDDGFRLAEGYYEVGVSHSSELDNVFARFCEQNGFTVAAPANLLATPSITALQQDWLQTYVSSTDGFED